MAKVVTVVVEEVTMDNQDKEDFTVEPHSFWTTLASLLVVAVEVQEAIMENAPIPRRTITDV